MRRQQKAILIGGASKSGKTLLRFILDRHSELHSFSGINLLKHDLFRYFPEWLVGQPRDIRVAWVDIYRRMCLTRFYCFCVRGIHDITLTCPKCRPLSRKELHQSLVENQPQLDAPVS